MTSVITGDIIKSRSFANQSLWLNTLKKSLSKLSEDTSLYEIYRGDSFQIEYQDFYQSFRAAVYIKACLKSVKGLDARMSIGIGKKSYQGKTVSESNGEVFMYSGSAFEDLKKEKVNLKIKTDDLGLDMELNLFFKLALIAMDNWTVNSAEIVKLSLENPNMIQKEIATIIGISQDAVSKRQKRAYLDEILELNSCYKNKIHELKEKYL